MRPDQLVVALGLGGLPGAGDGLIGPARKYGKTHDILYYLRERPNSADGKAAAETRQPDGGYWLEREYWVDRLPPYMVRVVQFRDLLGRVSMSALLEDYRPARDGGLSVPHTVSIIWHQDDGKFTMSIAHMRGLPAEKVSPTAFVRPTEDDLPGGIEGVIQVDADCD